MACEFGEGFKSRSVGRFDSVTGNSSWGTSTRSGGPCWRPGQLSSGLGKLTAAPRGELFAAVAVYNQTLWNTAPILWMLDATGGMAGLVMLKNNYLVELHCGDLPLPPVVASAVCPLPGSTWVLVELHVLVSDTPGVGRVQVRLDGVQVIDYPVSSTQQIVMAGLCASRSVFADANSSFEDFTIHNTLGGSEDSWVGDVRYVATLPTGNGTTSGLHGSDGNQADNYQLVDELASGAHNGDLDFVHASQADLLDTYASTDLTTLPNSVPIRAVRRYIQTAIARKTNAGVATRLALALRSGGVDRIGSDQDLPGDWGTISQVWDTDPATGLAWDVAGLNAAELLGAKSRGSY